MVWHVVPVFHFRVSQHGLIIEVPSATEVPPSSSTAADERGNLGAGMKRIAGAILDEVLDNTDRKVGVGFIGRLLNWEQRTSQIDDNIKEQIDRIASNEHRWLFLKASLTTCSHVLSSSWYTTPFSHVMGCSFVGRNSMQGTPMMSSGLLFFVLFFFFVNLAGSTLRWFRLN